MSEINVNRKLLTKVGVHVEDSGGGGRPVVLIHGWPLSTDSWSSQVPVLVGAGYRVVAYDRRGFGMSDKPGGGYDYDTLTDDLEGLMTELDLHDATLIGFSMGGGETARYASTYGENRLRSVVFASAVPPFLMKSDDNPEGPLTTEKAATMTEDLRADREAFFNQFTTEFFSAKGVMMVSETQRQTALAMFVKIYRRSPYRPWSFTVVRMP